MNVFLGVKRLPKYSVLDFGVKGHKSRGKSELIEVALYLIKAKWNGTAISFINNKIYDGKIPSFTNQDANNIDSNFVWAETPARALWYICKLAIKKKYWIDPKTLSEVKEMATKEHKPRNPEITI